MGENKKFYEKNWFMWLMLILVAPVGLILVWAFHKDFSKNKKIILSTVFALWFLLLIAIEPSSSETVNQSEPSTEVAITSEVPTELQSEITSEESSEISDEVQSTVLIVNETFKTNAEIYDTKIIALINSLDSHYTNFVSVVENGGSDLDVYNAAKNINEVGLDTFSKVLSLSCDSDIEGFKDYQDATLLYASYIKDIGEKVQKYADDKKTSDLSDAQSLMQDKQTIALGLIAKRMTFLQNAGFKDLEIGNILEGKNATE